MHHAETTRICTCPAGVSALAHQGRTCAAALQAVVAAARAVVDYGAPDGDPGRFVTAIVQLREALRAYDVAAAACRQSLQRHYNAQLSALAESVQLAPRPPWPCLDSTRHDRPGHHAP